MPPEDGFYEQHLVRNQMAQLTGRPLEAGYASEEAQYRALMTSGVQLMQALSIRPGVGLTAEQAQALTSDVVLMENLLAHAIAGCAAGAARSGDCSAGAIGAAVGELAASQYDPDQQRDQTETVQFASMVAGIAAAVAGGDAAAVNTAAAAGGNAAANNWLATQQVRQYRAELAAATSLLDQARVEAKWFLISGNQNVLTAGGIGLGLAESGWSDVKAMAGFLTDPVAGLDGLRQLVTSSEVRQQLTDSAFAELDARISRMTTALQVGGDEAAVQLGQDIGALAWQVGSVLTGAAGTARAATALAEVGINVGSAGLDAMRVRAAAGVVDEGVATNVASQTPTSIPPPKVTIRGEGITEISPSSTSVVRQGDLNTPDVAGSSRLRPAEAAAAAQLEPVIGTMQRYDGPPTIGSKSPDFVITSGSNTGKTVDMMYTTANNSASEIAGMNRFFEQNMTVPLASNTLPPGVLQIQDHFVKADIVAMDVRTLTPQNQQILMNHIRTLPATQQSQIILIK